MAHNLTAGMLAMTQAKSCAPVMFVQINTAVTPVRFWNGYGNMLWNAQTWVGGGNLMGIGAITEQNNVAAVGCALTLSGINTALIATALADLQRYLPAMVWLGGMNDMFALISNPFMILNGRVDTAKIISTGKDATITVTAESRLIAMKNPKWRRFTDLDQRIERPNDAGFTFVDTIQDATINFHG